jgi:cell pole-organizing protein PopZ
MANTSSPQHEPTMEEILASIRKIISEDSNEPAQPAPQPVVQLPASVAPLRMADADVLELTQEVHEEPAPPPAPIIAVAPQPAPLLTPVPPPAAPAPEPVATVIELPPAPVAAPAPVEPEAPVHATAELVSDRARSAIDDALSGVDFGSPHEEAAPAAAVAPLTGVSVEAIFDRAVRETFDPVLSGWLHDQSDAIVERMKPAIREWMEENLPPMLKAAVEAEVARAFRSRVKR